MELGALTETINITGETPLVETRTSDVTQLVESKSIEDLPLGGATLVNGKPIKRARLYAGDRIQIGSTAMVFQEKTRKS